MDWIRIRPIDTEAVYHGSLLVRRLRAHAAWQNHLPIQPHRLAFLLSLKPTRNELTPAWIDLLRTRLEMARLAHAQGQCSSTEPNLAIITSPYANATPQSLPPLQLEWPGRVIPIVQEIVERVWQEAPPPAVPGDLFDTLI